ncbi:hypothetical protein TruAng_003219 [Truncatella angustata]|nr:hypothetical protein TruAng_003219 [Truncatella angustata]
MSETTHSSTGKPKARNGHCKRFWWLYLLILVVIVVIVVPVILLVAVPRIAQNKVNEAELHIDGVKITQSETGSFNMAINSSITTDGNHNPPLAFAAVTFPETPSDALVLVNISQPVTIDHISELTIFNSYLLTNQSVNVRVEGDTTVRVSGIARDYPITFSKDVTFAGFNAFNGISVANPHVSLSTRNNFNATTNIPNPTSWTVEVGNASFHTYFNGSNIGNTNITNMVLYPGDNNFNIKGDVAQADVIKALQQRPYCENGGLLPVQISGNSVVNNGQTIPWLADALASFNVSLDIDIGEAIKNDIGLSLPCSNTTIKL